MFFFLLLVLVISTESPRLSMASGITFGSSSKAVCGFKRYVRTISEAYGIKRKPLTKEKAECFLSGNIPLIS